MKLIYLTIAVLVATTSAWAGDFKADCSLIKSSGPTLDQTIVHLQPGDMAQLRDRTGVSNLKAEILNRRDFLQVTISEENTDLFIQAKYSAHDLVTLPQAINFYHKTFGGISYLTCRLAE